MIAVLHKLKGIRKNFFCIAIMLAFFSNTVVAQTKTISGRVTDVNKNPIANVSVFVKGTTVGTATATDGSYSINVPANGTQIEFTSLGYEPQLFTIGNRKSFSPVMAGTGSKILEEVVVTGISRIKKSQFAGAASKVTAKEVENKPAGSFDQMLQGRVPGLVVITGSGQPGTTAGLIIRGQNSISGGTGPLFVIDGIPIEGDAFQGINTNDIASIEVLRDAATQALYGSRGSGGVIVITTKRVSSGKMKFGYSAQLGSKSKPDYALTPMNTTQLLKAQHDYGKITLDNDNQQIPGWYYSADNPRVQGQTPAEQLQSKHIYDSIAGINTDWFNEFFRRGTFKNHEISLSGGSDKTRFYSNLGFYSEQGIVNPSDMKRLSWRTNVDFSDDRFTVALSSNISYAKRNYDPNFPGFIFNSFLTPAIQTPYARVRKPDGSYDVGETVSDIGTSKYFAAQYLDVKAKDKTYNDQAKITVGANLSYRFSPNLVAAVHASADFRETQNSAYNNRETFIRQTDPSQAPTTQAGSQQEDLDRALTTDFRPSLTFTKTVNDKHDIEVTAMGEYIQEDGKNFTLIGYGIDPRIGNTPGAITQGNADNDLFATVGGSKYQATTASGLLLGRYTYAGKYTLTGSYRKDGSSRLPKANRWTGFYSVGAVWDITKEKFASNSKIVNVLRFKVSYGGSGNGNNFPGPYYYQSQYGTGSYAGLPTQGVATPGNPDAKWETTYTLNIGTDFELANRRIYGDLNVYNKKTDDLYVDRNLSAESGGYAVPVNAGAVQNRGFEWNVNVDVIRKKDLVVTLLANGAYNKNKLLSIGGETPYGIGTSFLEVGLPLGSHYETAWAGVDAATGSPLYYTKDGRLTNVYSADDKVARWGTWEAPWKGGFGTNIRFKAIELSVFFSWQRGAVKSDNLEYFTENPNGFLAGGYNQSASLNFWQQPGDIASTPNPNYAVNFSSKLLHDASFMRLRDITMSYTFPKSLFAGKKIFSSAKFYVQATNVYIWTKWRGLDPEAGAANLNLGEYPNPRAITVGLNTTF